MTLLKKLISIVFGEIKDEVKHVEFNSRKTEKLPFFNEWQKQLNQL